MYDLADERDTISKLSQVCLVVKTGQDRSMEDLPRHVGDSRRRGTISYAVMYGGPHTLLLVSIEQSTHWLWHLEFEYPRWCSEYYPICNTFSKTFINQQEYKPVYMHT